MSVGIIGLIIIAFLLVLLAFGVHIAVALGLSGLCGLALILGIDPTLSKLALTPFEAMSYDFSVLPLFVLMAEILFVSDIAKDLYNFAAKWLGHLPGGIAMATIAAATLFAAMCGSSIVGIVTFGLIAIPEFKKYNYDMSLATGSICAGGPMSVLIPPSGFLIFYGILTETSISSLFTAALLPGIMLAVMYVLCILIICKVNPKLGPPGPKYTLKEKISSTGQCIESLILIILVVGGIILGWFTPTEGAGVGAFAAFLVSLIRKRINWEKTKKAFIETIKTTGMIYVILICALLFKYTMSASNLPIYLANFIEGLTFPPLVIIILIILMYIVLGTAMDELSMIMVTLPIIFPLVFQLGFNPLWFGIIVVRMMMIAGVTPPTGLPLFVMQKMANVPIQTVYKGVLPFICADVIQVALLIVFPSIVTLLPTVMSY